MEIWAKARSGVAVRVGTSLVNPTKIAMIAMTTNNSISVNPRGDRSAEPDFISRVKQDAYHCARPMHCFEDVAGADFLCRLAEAAFLATPRVGLVQEVLTAFDNSSAGSHCNLLREGGEGT